MAKQKNSEELGYTPKLVPTSEVKLNPSNPRVIEDAKFLKLVNSINEAPWMLKIRPIVTNKDGIVLGGNQRLKACREAGLEKVWVVNADDLDDEMQREFLIKDNLDFGKWDLELLKVHFDMEKVEGWGLELGAVNNQLSSVGDQNLSSADSLSSVSDDGAREPEMDQNELEKKYETYQNNTIKQVVLYYPDELYQKVCLTLDEISQDLDCDDNSEVVLKLIEYYQFQNGTPEERVVSASVGEEKGE